MINKPVKVEWKHIKYTCKECGDTFEVDSDNGYFTLENIEHWLRWCEEHNHSNGMKINTW